jgi:DNA-binding transcriptional ArsR family regulator
MGIFDVLKKLFKKKEAEEIVESNQNNQQSTAVQQVQTSVQHEPTSVQHQTVITTPVEQDPTHILEKPHKIEVIDTIDAIESWEKTVQAAHQHPLSQVKIINTQILEELSNVLKSMDNKMNRLEKLDKLDEIYEILLRTDAELKAKGVTSQFLNSAMAEIERLTIKDKDVLEWIARQSHVTANQLAEYINLSRSTASFRLNRLSDLGVLDKESIGKKIYYKVKNMPQFPEETKGQDSGNPDEPSVQTNADEFD